jgi:hypothetical protein
LASALPSTPVHMRAPARPCNSAANGSSHADAQECRHHVRVSTPTVDGTCTQSRWPVAKMAATPPPVAKTQEGEGATRRAVAHARVAVVAERAARRRAADACAARPP